jgi:DNA-binding transcriptional LysR family regulator
MFEPLADETHGVIAGAQHPLAGKRGLSLADVAGQAWVLPEQGSVLRDRFTSLFVQNRLALPTNIVETTSLPVIASLLTITEMVTAQPATAVQSYVKAGVLTVLMEDLGVEIGSFGIVTRRDHPLSPGAQLLLAALRETAPKLYSSPVASAASRRRR